MSARFATARRAGLAVVFAWFAIGGVAHFTATDSFVGIVPPWVPEPELAVLVTGAFELLGALGLLHRRTRAMAGVGLIVLSVAVTPANVHMLQQADAYPRIPVWALVARLPLQLGLIALIGWCSGAFAALAKGRSRWPGHGRGG